MDDLLLDDPLDFPDLEPSLNGGAPVDPRYVAARAVANCVRGRDPKTPRPRTRVGLLEIAPSHFGKESDLAVRLGAYAVSLAQCVLDNATEGSAWLGLDAMRLLQRLDFLASESTSSASPGDCRLVTHLDLVLGALSTPQRELFWREAFSNLPQRPRSLILLMPRGGSTLPPADALQQWRDSGRAAVVE